MPLPRPPFVLGFSALHLAAKNNHQECAKKLIQVKLSVHYCFRVRHVGSNFIYVLILQVHEQDIGPMTKQHA